MIRPATRADARGIAEVHVRTWQAAYRHAFPAELLDSLSIEEREARWRDQGLADSAAETLVAERAGRVVGFASAGPSRDPDCDGELWGIYVEPEEWGSGTGAALLDAALERLRAAGFREAILWVLGDNPRARRFYEKHGWSPDGTEKDGVHLDTEVHEVRYRRIV